MKVIPAMRAFLVEYAQAWKEGGYLTSRGLIPSPPDVQAKATEAATQLKPMSAAELN